METAGNF